MVPETTDDGSTTRGTMVVEIVDYDDHRDAQRVGWGDPRAEWCGWTCPNCGNDGYAPSATLERIEINDYDQVKCDGCTVGR
jgi:hypothetical protein